MKNTALLIVLFLAAGAVQAQTAGTVTLRANATSATGSMVPVLTWSTSPTATRCTASGGWSGTKSASGTQTLSTITASTNYTLTCTWGVGSATVRWTAPTTNTDGSRLTNLVAYRVYYGTSSNSLSQVNEITDSSATAATISALTPATWYFKVRAVNSAQVESSDSNISSKAISGASAAKTVGITITPKTTATRRMIATTVYDIVRVSPGNWVLGRSVGTAPIGTPCRTYYLQSNLYGVETGYVKIWRAPRGDTLVARCELP